MVYKIIARTLTYNKPGLSPTVKNGTDMGWVSSGTFISTREVNGWLDMAPNRWIMKSACEVVDDEPEPEPTFEPQNMYVQTFNGVEYVTTETWKRTA
jgi:hypothetical protein